MLNSVIIQGRLTRDPEIRTTQAGIMVASFTLASDKDFGEGCDFINCTAWRKSAAFADKYLHKGMMIIVQGRLTSSTYEKDGQKRTKHEVTVDQFNFCEKRNVSTSTFEDLGGDDGTLPF